MPRDHRPHPHWTSRGTRSPRSTRPAATCASRLRCPAARPAWSPRATPYGRPPSTPLRSSGSTLPAAGSCAPRPSRSVPGPSRSARAPRGWRTAVAASSPASCRATRGLRPDPLPAAESPRRHRIGRRRRGRRVDRGRVVAARARRRRHPRGRRAGRRRPLSGVAAGGGAVWAISADPPSVVRIDPVARSVTDRLAIVSRGGDTAPNPVGIAADDGSVWVLNTNTATVTRIDPVARGVIATIPIGVDRVPNSIASDGARAWVANEDGTLSRIDPGSDAADSCGSGESCARWPRGQPALGRHRGARPTTPRRRRMIPPRCSACSPSRALSSAGAAAAPRRQRPARRPPGSSRHRPARRCPTAGPGRPQLSDRLSTRCTRARYKGHGVQNGTGDQDGPGRARAGGPASTPSACRRARRRTRRRACRARRSARATRAPSRANRSVLGVIGPLTSDCATHMLATLNQAPGGPLATIAGGNTYVGPHPIGARDASGRARALSPDGPAQLRAPGADRRRPGRRHRTLRRAARARRAFVVEDGGSYGHGLAATFQYAAGELGLDAGRQRPAGRSDERRLPPLVGASGPRRPDIVLHRRRHRARRPAAGRRPRRRASAPASS